MSNAFVKNLFKCSSKEVSWKAKETKLDSPQPLFTLSRCHLSNNSSQSESLVVKEDNKAKLSHNRKSR